MERWWCPVCHDEMFRWAAIGRRPIYCSNRCRQRAYRYRRAHHLRTDFTPERPTEEAISSTGARHSLRGQGDFMATLADARRRQVSVCGVLALPKRHTGFRSRPYFRLDGLRTCRTCLRLVLPAGTLPPPIWLVHRPDLIGADGRRFIVPPRPPATTPATTPGDAELE
jgi:hypothetical protein